MRIFLTIICCAMLSVGPLSADGAYHLARVEIIDGEEVPSFMMREIFCFARPKDMSRYYKMVYNVKKVYPIAQEAKRLLDEIETNVQRIKSPKDQKEYVKKMEKQLSDKYTPVLKQMTFSQGKVLIKLLDRQTSKTGYAIVKELRGGFRATIYQGIARLFGANLKDTYDGEGEDALIEEIIDMYELGLI